MPDRRERDPLRSRSDLFDADRYSAPTAAMTTNSRLTDPRTYLDGNDPNIPRLISSLRFRWTPALIARVTAAVHLGRVPGERSTPRADSGWGHRPHLLGFQRLREDGRGAVGGGTAPFPLRLGNEVPQLLDRTL